MCLTALNCVNEGGAFERAAPPQMWLVRDPCGLMTVVLAYTMLWFGVLCVGMCVLAPWMGGTAGGALHSFALYALAGLTNVCHLRAMLTDPGAVPPGAQQPGGGVSERDHNGSRAMRTRTRMRTVLRGIGGAVLVAAAFYLALAAPGLLSDRDSMVPRQAREARR